MLAGSIRRSHVLIRLFDLIHPPECLSPTRMPVGGYPWSGPSVLRLSSSAGRPGRVPTRKVRLMFGRGTRTSASAPTTA